jgi:hypothetical protein
VEELKQQHGVKARWKKQRGAEGMGGAQQQIVVHGEADWIPAQEQEVQIEQGKHVRGQTLPPRVLRRKRLRGEGDGGVTMERESGGERDGAARIGGVGGDRDGGMGEMLRSAMRIDGVGRGICRVQFRVEHESMAGGKESVHGVDDRTGVG